MFGGKCYKYFGSETEKYTWNEARESCLGHRSHLVSIHSEEEHRFLQTIIPTFGAFTQFFPWIGAKYVVRNKSLSRNRNPFLKSNLIDAHGTEDGWQWDDASVIDYWDEKYSPSGSDLANRCMAINSWAYGLWVDTGCDTGHTYVCKRSLI